MLVYDDMLSEVRSWRKEVRVFERCQMGLLFIRMVPDTGIAGSDC